MRCVMPHTLIGLLGSAHYKRRGHQSCKNDHGAHGSLLGHTKPRNALVLGAEKAKGMPRRNVVNFNPSAAVSTRSILQFAMKHALCMHNAMRQELAAKPGFEVPAAIYA
jgi:hypothetical protein